MCATRPPAGAYLTDAQAQELLGATMRAGGDDVEGALRMAFAERLRRDPDTARAVREFIGTAANDPTLAAPPE